MIPVILIFVVAGLALLAFVLFTKIQQNAGSSESTPPGEISVKPRPLLTRDEAAFLAVLEQAVPGQCRVFVQVRLADVVTVDRSTKAGFAQANRAAQKHCDYVIVRVDDYQPIAVCELDGWNHSGKRQAERDAVKDHILIAAGVPIVRVKSAKSYQLDQVKQMLAPHLRSEAR